MVGVVGSSPIVPTNFIGSTIRTSPVVTFQMRHSSHPRSFPPIGLRSQPHRVRLTRTGYCACRAIVPYSTITPLFIGGHRSSRATSQSRQKNPQAIASVHNSIFLRIVGIQSGDPAAKMCAGGLEQNAHGRLKLFRFTSRERKPC